MSTQPTAPNRDKECPRCSSTVFTRMRRCALCGWFIGWGA